MAEKGDQAADAKTASAPLKVQGCTGVCKWFSVRRGFGFITRDDNKEDIFVHRSNIHSPDSNQMHASLAEGELVQFDVDEGKKGLEAHNVTGPNGENVKGYVRRGRRGGRGGERGRGRGGRSMARGARPFIVQPRGPQQYPQNAPQYIYMENVNYPPIGFEPVDQVYRGGRGGRFRGGRGRGRILATMPINQYAAYEPVMVAGPPMFARGRGGPRGFGGAPRGGMVFRPSRGGGRGGRRPFRGGRGGESRGHTDAEHREDDLSETGDD